MRASGSATGSTGEPQLRRDRHSGFRPDSFTPRQPADTLFALSLAVFFLLLLVLISIVWEIVRKCRSSWREHHHRPSSSEHWRRLEDGSSVLLNNEGRPITRLGPMASLMRHGPDTTRSGGGLRSSPRAGHGGGYQPAHMGGGETHEMRADALTMSGTYAPYDPPAAMHGYEIGSQVGPANRNSIATTRSGWSGETRVASEQSLSDKKQDEVRAPTNSHRKRCRALILDHPDAEGGSSKGTVVLILQTAAP